MSHIFDALQRSVTKRTDSAGALSMTGPELLERAELAATSQWKPELQADSDDGLDGPRTNVLFGPDGFGRTATAEDVAAVTLALEAEQRRECFSQFQTLKVSLPEDSRLVCLTDVAGASTEAFRLLGFRVRHLRASKGLRSILITSTVPEEGKSLSAANLACTLAARERLKVLLIEGDVRRPSLGRLFGIPSLGGLCNHLQGERSLIASVYRLEEAGLWILPAGDRSAVPIELIQSPQLADSFQKLNSWFDWIVIDSPPMLPLADTSVWARLADGILLVARRGKTEKRRLQKGLEAMDHSKLIGAIMNSSNGAGSEYDYYNRPASESH